MRAIRFVLAGVAVAILACSGAYGQAIMGTVSGSNQAIVYPSPGIGLPVPAAIPVPGITGHGVTYYGADNALVSDINGSRVSVVQISTASVVDTIDTSSAGYGGAGTVAVAPSLTFALACGSSTLFRIAAPFGAGSVITPVALTGSIASYQTQGIVFAPGGRAFVYTDAGINVLDYPYDSVAFFIPVSGNSWSGAIAITPDGGQLLITDLSGSAIRIFTAPYSAGSTAVSLNLPGANGPDGIMVTPDGSTALVASVWSPAVHAVSAPFSAGSAVQQIPLPTAFGSGFEDVGISADGQLAALVGMDSGTQPACFIQAPFTAAGATVHAVAIAGGRGAGAVRFLPPGLAAGLTVSKTGPASAATGSNITYTINYGNTGGATAFSVVIKDTVPAGTSFVSATDGGTLSGGVVTWAIGDLPPSASGSVQLTVNLTATSGSVTNGAYTIEGSGIAPIFGPPVTTTVEVTPVVNLTCADWVSEVGTWGPPNAPCGDLTSTAATAVYESASFFDVFDDFTFEAELVATRPIQPTAANTVFVRGDPTPRGLNQVWDTGYAFAFTTAASGRKYSIFRYSNGRPIVVQAWVAPVPPAVINPSGVANTLTVVAVGGTLTFYLNGTPVKTITGQPLLSGQVGLGMVRSYPTGPTLKDTLVVNAASVTPGGTTKPTRGVSAAQERANEAANRAALTTKPDPLFSDGGRKW